MVGKEMRDVKEESWMWIGGYDLEPHIIWLV